MRPRRLTCRSYFLGSVFSDFFLVNNTGSCCGNTVVNHLMNADDIVLFVPSAKSLQRIINVSYTYGCDNDIIFNSATSQLIFIDTLKYGHMPKDILLGLNALS